MKRIFFILLILLMTVQAAFAAEQVFFYHTDPAGTPLAMTNTSGTVVWKADYKPFGEEQSVTATMPNDKRFVGKEKDEETGLSYFGARYENARIGRFIAPDPVRAVDEKTSKTNEKMLLNPQRLNTYTYGINNPYRYVDPDGHNPILIGLGLIWLGEMMMPQTMGSSHRDSFIDRHSGDLMMLPLGIEREGAAIVSKGVSSAVTTGSKLFNGMKMSTNEALGAAESFLGKGYKDMGKGRYVSGDGMRQVRMGDADILGKHGGGPHINFDTFNRPIGKGATPKTIHVYIKD